MFSSFLFDYNPNEVLLHSSNTFKIRIVKYMKNMKRIILVTLVSITALVSCKKDYTCECSGGNSSVTFLIENSSKSDAEKTCTSSNSTNTCKLK